MYNVTKPTQKVLSERWYTKFEHDLLNFDGFGHFLMVFLTIACRKLKEILEILVLLQALRSHISELRGS